MGSVFNNQDNQENMTSTALQKAGQAGRATKHGPVELIRTIENTSNEAQTKLEKAADAAEIYGKHESANKLRQVSNHINQNINQKIDKLPIGEVEAMADVANTVSKIPTGIALHATVAKKAGTTIVKTGAQEVGEIATLAVLDKKTQQISTQKIGGLLDEARQGLPPEAINQVDEASRTIDVMNRRMDDTRKELIETSNGRYQKVKDITGLDVTEQKQRAASAIAEKARNGIENVATDFVTQESQKAVDEMTRQVGEAAEKANPTARREILKEITGAKDISPTQERDLLDNMKKSGPTPQNDTSNTLPPADDSSFLDTTPSALGKAGSAVGDALKTAGSVAVGIGHMALNTALSMDADTIAHLATGDAKQAVRAVAAQTLSRMHGLVMQEVERQQGSPFRTPGIAGPIPEPDETARESIERTVNDPRNASIFDGIARRAERILTTFDDTDPSAVVVSKVMEALRGGHIKVQPHILIPDMLPQEDGAPRKPQGSERVLDIAGVDIPVKLPPVVLDASGGVSGRTPDFNPDANTPIHRGEDGAVHVKGYTKSDGTRVASYSRTAPDDSIANNRGFHG